MKTYRQYLDFIQQPKFVGNTYSSIRASAINNGFKGWLFDYYTRKYHRRYKTKRTKTVLKTTLKYILYGFAYFGIMCITWDVFYLIKTATIRNETETLALVVDTCYKAPKLCKYAVITGNLKLTAIEKTQDETKAAKND